TQQRLHKLEQKLQDRQTPSASQTKESPRDLQGISERIGKVEDKLQDTSPLGGLSDRLSISGLIEAEAGYEDMDYDDPSKQDEDSSDITLATVEMGIDADISKYVSGHVLFLWEEDDTEPVDLDEGYITLDGADKLPMYANIGKLYVPFGYFGTHFISDPLTLELGETRESAVQAGWGNDFFDISAAVFNGDVDESGEDNHVESYVANAAVSLPQNTLPGLNMSFGGSYISNIADSDGLEGEVSGDLTDYVPGLGAFLSLSYVERIFLEAEYVGALDNFETGELGFDAGQHLEPRTWNFELAVAPADKWTLAARYEGGDDLGDFLPETQYGGAVSYSLFENTALALEYLHGEFENDDEYDRITTQLAVEF
ncbi:MAG: LbtU family siderophore porin, partial [Desulfovermiculus sp.]